ncbi:MAG: beta-galactosidase [Cellvibrionaceae bacterium]|nr:beta-galactosidase [Cellvibrionaceae bacterium]
MFGICYYPEHWPESQWKTDARMMAGLGLTYVRIGEFAWSRLEPNPGELNFAWLDKAIEILNDAGLKVILGTPTATPPKWLVDKWPEVLPVSPETGRVRGFGSRRHYDFSSKIYLREALRISEEMAKRYGEHNAVIGWQTDNELCCHDTTLSGSNTAKQAFQCWCEQRYGSIDALNEAWGNVFWSMEYRHFGEIDLPLGAVTETNPAHRLAYRRFSSDKVIDFHQQMIAVIRQHAPGKLITHNFIPMVDTGVDNYALAKNLDFTSYDNYPLGRTDLQFADWPAEKLQRYMRTGHPDFGTYYQDQTRGLNDGEFWIMEQQPGPVNWAANNPRPAPGMIRFWTLEAFAHGASCVCYFRWRQAPFAQEQMHAGLLRPDGSKADAWPQMEQARDEIKALDLLTHSPSRASVALISGAEAQWVSEIERQGEAYDFNNIQFEFYSALRALGVNVDFVSVEADFSQYTIVIAPSLPIIDEAFVQRCKRSKATFIFAPRAGAKTREFAYPLTLPPGPLQAIAPLRVLSVETLRADCPGELHWQGKIYEAGIWREELAAENGEVLGRYEDGKPAILQFGNVIYMGTLTCSDFLKDFFHAICDRAGIATYRWGEDIRVCQRGALMFAFNYAGEAQDLPLPDDGDIVLGQRRIAPYGVTVWKSAASALQ